MKEQQIGLLEGLPISVKDQFDQKGFHSTCGMMARLDAPKRQDGLLLAKLRAQGAIPFVRSNAPQLCLAPESDNRIWGATRNPYNLARTSGGSSGGESALLASGASPLGIGTDIGGSVRIPACYCGLAAFKPSSARVSSKVKHKKNTRTCSKNDEARVLLR